MDTLSPETERGQSRNLRPNELPRTASANGTSTQPTPAHLHTGSTLTERTELEIPYGDTGLHGTPRSGTTLVGSTRSSLPDIPTVLNYTKDDKVWPRRPQVEIFTPPGKSKNECQWRLPEINVPLEHVIVSQEDRTIKFSAIVSSQILPIIDAASQEKANTRSLLKLKRRLLHKATSIHAKISGYRGPSLPPVELDEYNMPKSVHAHIANIHFAECLIHKEEYLVKEGRIIIKQFTAQRMLERAFLWLDDQHRILESFHWLTALPRPMPRGDGKYMGILKEHMVNGRWIWITELKTFPNAGGPPNTCGTRSPGSKHQNYRQVLMLDMKRTADLYDARVGYFTLLPEDPKRAVEKFCSRQPLNGTDLLRVWPRLTSLAYYLKLGNDEYIVSFRKRLPKEMEKFQAISSLPRSILEEAAIRGFIPASPNAGVTYHWFRRGPVDPQKQVKTDSDFRRRAVKFLSMPDNSCACGLDCESTCPSREAINAKKDNWRTFKQELMAYLKEKRKHSIDCSLYPCHWSFSEEATCAQHEKKLRGSPCVRCYIRSKMEEELDMIPVEEEPLPKQVFWDSEHQAKDMPEGWCCHRSKDLCDTICRNYCKQRSSECWGSGKCRVPTHKYEEVDSSELGIVMKHIFQADESLRHICPALFEETKMEKPMDTTRAPGKDRRMSRKYSGLSMIHSWERLIRKASWCQHIAQIQHPAP